MDLAGGCAAVQLVRAKHVPRDAIGEIEITGKVSSCWPFILPKCDQVPFLYKLGENNHIPMF
jgi:hypothetical protein